MYGESGLTQAIARFGFNPLPKFRFAVLWMLGQIHSMPSLENVVLLILFSMAIHVRSMHRPSRARRPLGLRVHVFEEGYMRPFWISYERGGSNGNSRLMDTTVAQMQTALERSDMEAPMPPSHWGDMRQHVFYGALYQVLSQSFLSFAVTRNGAIVCGQP